MQSRYQIFFENTTRACAELIKLINGQPIDEVQYICQETCEPSNLFKFRRINITEHMKNKTDHESVSNKIITDNWNILGNGLLKIINTLLETGIFPENWITSITSIEKVLKTRKREEFRPMNTLKVRGKIMEKVVKLQLKEFIKYHGTSINNQIFRKKH